MSSVPSFLNVSIAFEAERVYLELTLLKKDPVLALTPADLSVVVAVLLGLPVNTVKNYDRRLMEAGLRTKKGHGRGSAIMGPEEAALLLAAVAASDDASRAPECVRKLYRLPFAGLSPQNNGEFVEPSFLCKIIGVEEKAVNTFGKALVAIMKYMVATPDFTHTFDFEVSIMGGVPYSVDLQIFERNPPDLLDINAKLKSWTIEFLRKDQMIKTVFSGLGVRRFVFSLAVMRLADVLAGRIDKGKQTDGGALVGTQKAKAKSKKKVA